MSTYLRWVLVTVVVMLLAGILGCHGGGQTDVARTDPAEAPVGVSQAGLRGDLNGSGLPDVSDAIGILRIVVGLDAPNALADCNGDGNTGVADAIMVLRCVVGLGEWPIRPGEHSLGDEMTGPDGQTLVWVPGGSFMMGSEGSWDDERPIHRVTLDGFWIGQCEVTNVQYEAFCDAAVWWFPGDSDEGDDHPVVYVGWDDAQAYCDHYGYTLPTEAQWEYAARGPAVPTYPWGDAWDQSKCCNDDNRGPGGSTFPVGSFPAGASWCGALDMAGNVFDWCADWYDEEYYQVSPELNPPGPDSGTHRVQRGGSWCNGDWYCGAATRAYADPFDWYDDSGFRVAQVADGS